MLFFEVNKGQRHFGNVRTVPTKEQQAAFGEAVRRLMKSHSISQRALGEAVAEGTRGVDKPYSQSTVRDWLDKSAPEPQIVFYIEGFLLVAPGTLSQLLGYLPLDAREVVTTQQALMNDPALDAGGRDMALLIYLLHAEVPLTDATLSEWMIRELQRIVIQAPKLQHLLPQPDADLVEARIRLMEEAEERERLVHAAMDFLATPQGQQFALAADTGNEDEPAGPAKRRPSPPAEPEGA